VVPRRHGPGTSPPLRVRGYAGLRNLDEQLLGEHYEQDSIVTDPDTNHFDLIEPTRVERYVDALVERLGRETHDALALPALAQRRRF